MSPYLGGWWNGDPRPKPAIHVPRQKTSELLIRYWVADMRDDRYTGKAGGEQRRNLIRKRIVDVDDIVFAVPHERDKRSAVGNCLIADNHLGRAATPSRAMRRNPLLLASL